MILAAGLGLRMRPLTNDTPKPLIEVGGRRLIDRALDRLREAELEKVVVNAHHLAAQIDAWAAEQDDLDLAVSHEHDLLLETGGGVRKALPQLGDAPFFVLNSDSFWLEGATPALARMRAAWNGSEMDGLLLLSPLSGSIGYSGTGDFVMSPEGCLTRRRPGQVVPFVYTGCCLLDPSLFDDVPADAFSLNLVFDKALARNRLFGLRHDGLWLHVGTPEAIGVAEDALDAL